MTAHVIRAFCLALLTVGAALTTAADQPGRESLAKKLAEFKGAERGQIIAVTDEAAVRAFPGHSFYVLRFRQYPIAQMPPGKLAANNLFVVKPDGSVEHLPDAAALESFFRATLAPIRTEGEARDAATAWLRLTQEFHQDGFFEFLVPRNPVRVAATGTGGRQVTGKAEVNPKGGNAGEIVATLSFDQAGRLVKVSETARIKKGIRPICQATKLLDPDPVVRGMAEQAILVMGKAAKEYLTEQRMKASPELQQAIDRIWQRILQSASSPPRTSSLCEGDARCQRRHRRRRAGAENEQTSAKRSGSEHEICHQLT